jgi:hypothetical protein
MKFIGLFSYIIWKYDHIILQLLCFFNHFFRDFHKSLNNYFRNEYKSNVPFELIELCRNESLGLAHRQSSASDPFEISGTQSSWLYEKTTEPSEYNTRIKKKSPQGYCYP